MGVVKDVTSSNRSVRADYFAPISWASPADLNYNTGYFGSCVAALLARTRQDVPLMEEELRSLENNLELVDNFDKFSILEKDVTDVYAWNFIGSQREREGKNFLMIIFGILTFFLIIPVLNLVNLNVTRIFERSSEIGVRKAFGAKTGHLLLQFLFENLIITFIGGVIGIMLTLALMQVLNTSEALGTAKLTFNLTLLIISLIITFVFGLLSGFLPAWRISQTPVAGALKSGQL
ncbi:Macrolide export ATP-binding/permease protein MacB [compost metagenome]